MYSYCNALSAWFFAVDRALNSYIMIMIMIVGDSVSLSVDKAVNTATVCFRTCVAVTLVSLVPTVHRSVSVTGTVTVTVKLNLTAASAVTTTRGSVSSYTHDV